MDVKEIVRKFIGSLLLIFGLVYTIQTLADTVVLHLSRCITFATTTISGQEFQTGCQLSNFIGIQLFALPIIISAVGLTILLIRK